MNSLFRTFKIETAALDVEVETELSVGATSMEIVCSGNAEREQTVTFKMAYNGHDYIYLTVRAFKESVLD